MITVERNAPMRAGVEGAGVEGAGMEGAGMEIYTPYRVYDRPV